MTEVLVACLGSKNAEGGRLTQVAKLRADLTIALSNQLLSEGKHVSVITLGDHRNNENEPCHGRTLKTYIKANLDSVCITAYCPPTNTAEELTALNRFLKPKQNLLIATSPSHSIRVALLAECLIPKNNFRVIGYELPHDAPINEAAYDRETERIKRILNAQAVFDPQTGKRYPLYHTPTNITVQTKFIPGMSLIG